MLPRRRLHGSTRRAVRGYAHCRHAAMGTSGAAVTATRGMLVACAIVTDFGLIVRRVMRGWRRLLATVELMLRGVDAQRQCPLRKHRCQQQREGDKESQKRLDRSCHSMTITDRS